jgi:hypothetical protein
MNYHLQIPQMLQIKEYGKKLYNLCNLRINSRWLA